MADPGEDRAIEFEDDEREAIARGEWAICVATFYRDLADRLVNGAFTAFQEYARALSHRGVILAVCSKNDEANALEPFSKLLSVLPLESHLPGCRLSCTYPAAVEATQQAAVAAPSRLLTGPVYHNPTVLAMVIHLKTRI